MKPIRPYAEVWPELDSGDVDRWMAPDDDSRAAAIDWHFFATLMEREGRRVPQRPALDGASDMARCTWGLLADAAEGRLVVGTAYDAIAEQLGWRDSEGAPLGVHARIWFDEAVPELEARGVIRSIDGGVLLQRLSEVA